MMGELKCTREPAEEDFRANINISKNGTSIECKKGLWGVTSSTPEETDNQARWYFYQYWKDGEYTGEQLEVLKQTTNPRGNSVA